VAGSGQRRGAHELRVAAPCGARARANARGVSSLEERGQRRRRPEARERLPE
jgi:hypothetical protein